MCNSQFERSQSKGIDLVHCATPGADFFKAKLEWVILHLQGIYYLAKEMPNVSPIFS